VLPDPAADGNAVEIALRVRAFVDDVVVPAETTYDEAGGHGPHPDLRAWLQHAARIAGVFAPTAPRDLGGLGLDTRSQALVLEEAGRSLLGPLALNCAAPDEGNMLLLERVGDDRQQSRYLAPLARGEVRSCFAMTEPSPGAGADPGQLATTARRTSTGWVLDGHKWFITGADGADFVIVMATTAPGRSTMFLVDADNPGLTLKRTVRSLDETFAGGHGELLLDGCQVADSGVLGAPDEGFRYAQVRLAPARLTHCMRWLGAARRAHETAVAYAATRPMFGSRLADLGMAQQMIADNEIDIAASRGLIQEAARRLDAGQLARHETSVAKTFVAEAVGRIVDRALQLCGSVGVSYDSPIAMIFRDVRPFRIYDGPSEVHRWSIARRAVRVHESGGLPGAPAWGQSTA
jgi:acyl-CoA dehydrogenase